MEYIRTEKNEIYDTFNLIRVEYLNDKENYFLKNGECIHAIKKSKNIEDLFDYVGYYKYNKEKRKYDIKIYDNIKELYSNEHIEEDKDYFIIGILFIKNDYTLKPVAKFLPYYEGWDIL